MLCMEVVLAPIAYDVTRDLHHGLVGFSLKSLLISLKGQTKSNEVISVSLDPFLYTLVSAKLLQCKSQCLLMLYKRFLIV